MGASDTIQDRVHNIITEFDEITARREFGDFAVDEALGVQRVEFEPCRVGSVAIQLGRRTESPSSEPQAWIQDSAGEDPRTAEACGQLRQDINNMKGE